MQRDDRTFVVVAGCVGCVAALAALAIWLNTGITVENPQRPVVEVRPVDRPAPDVVPAVNRQQTLHASPAALADSAVRTAIEGLSSHPQFASWLVGDWLLRRFVTSVDRVAGGYTPRDELDVLEPIRPFLVRDVEGQLVISAGTFRRYDPVVEVLTSIDIDGAAALYRRFRPDLERVYSEVAWASSDFDSRFREAIDHLLEVEVPSGSIDVEQRAVYYAFADDELERLTDVQKQLVRMGHENAERVQQTLRELRTALGWPPREDVTGELTMVASLEGAEDAADEEAAEEVDIAAILEGSGLSVPELDARPAPIPVSTPTAWDPQP